MYYDYRLTLALQGSKCSEQFRIKSIPGGRTLEGAKRYVEALLLKDVDIQNGVLSLLYQRNGELKIP